MFKKISTELINKPKENDLKKSEPQPAIIDVLKNRGYSVTHIQDELTQFGLNKRESDAFIDIFVNGLHYTEVKAKYSIQPFELIGLKYKFETLVTKCGFNPNQIIGMFK